MAGNAGEQATALLEHAADPSEEAAGQRDLAAVFMPVARIASAFAALWLFVIALQLIRAGADGLRPLIEGLSADGVAGSIGFGWLGSYVVMSGSPVAAAAMSLLAGGAITDVEAFAMLNGTRLGASLIVLVVGVIAYLAGRRNPDGIYIGVVALLTALTLWAIALPLGLLVLGNGWLDGVRISSPGALSDFLETASDPVVGPLTGALSQGPTIVAGIAALVAAFGLFDRCLPNLEQPSQRLEMLSRALHQRYAMFALGSLVTLMTMSVSLSVTILVPLALKGYVRRERVIPYIMGANISTWVDTLLAAILLNSMPAFTVVLTEMMAGGIVSALVLIFFHRTYTRYILNMADWAVSSRCHLAVLSAGLFALPPLLLVL